MNKQIRHSWLLLALLMLLLTACSSSDGDGKAKPTLSIYVYAPAHPVVTRSGETADGTSEETNIHKLQIWIYKTGTEERIGYLELDEAQLANLNSTLHQEVFRMEIDEEFASAPSYKRSNVDVYVLANVYTENCGDAKGERTHRATPTEGSLETTHIAPDYFCPASAEVVKTYGLPMSGVMRSIQVTGESPVLKIETAKLQRRVSKIRFVFSSLENKGAVYIDGVELDGNLIPEYEYLFSDENKFHDTYKASKTMLFKDMGEVKTNDNPQSYAYEDNILTFVDKIDKGVQAGLLSEKNVFLRATNRKLTGNVYYRVGSDVSQRKARFEMTTAGDFDRNHTWIIYGYFQADQLDINTVDITPIDDVGSQDHNIYNW